MSDVDFVELHNSEKIKTVLKSNSWYQYQNYSLIICDVVEQSNIQSYLRNNFEHTAIVDSFDILREMMSA